MDILIKIKRIENKHKLNNILDNLEKYYISKCNSYRFGYNLTIGGEGSLEFHHSEETKKTMSIIRKNYPEEVKEKLRMMVKEFGKPYRFKSGDAMKYRHREIEQYTLDGEYIQTFYSIKEAMDFLNKKSNNGIVCACQGKYKTAYGYKWKYKSIK